MTPIARSIDRAAPWALRSGTGGESRLLGGACVREQVELVINMHDCSSAICAYRNGSFSCCSTRSPGWGWFFMLDTDTLTVLFNHLYPSSVAIDIMRDIDKFPNTVAGLFAGH